MSQIRKITCAGITIECTCILYISVYTLLFPRIQFLAEAPCRRDNLFRNEKGLFPHFPRYFLFRHLYTFSLMILDEFRRVTGEITRNIIALSDKLVDRYQQLFANSRLHRLPSLNGRKILLF